MLSELSKCPAIRLIASVDHVNSCLLWDKRTAARFNWLYFDVTTYAPYTIEAQEMPSLLIGRRCVPPLTHFFLKSLTMCLLFCHRSSCLAATARHDPEV